MEFKVGKVYRIRFISGKTVRVKLLEFLENGNWKGVDLTTGNEVTLKLKRFTKEK